MPGDARLRSLQNFHDVADAEFSTLQDVENPQPRSVGKRSEHQVDAAEHSVCVVLAISESRRLVLGVSHCPGPLSLSVIA